MSASCLLDVIVSCLLRVCLSCLLDVTVSCLHMVHVRIVSSCRVCLMVVRQPIRLRLGKIGFNIGMGLLI